MGQCGNQMGNNDQLLEGINVYFKEIRSGKFKLRTIATDMDGDTINLLNSWKYFEAFLDQNNMVFGNQWCGGVWAKGHYTEGAEMIDQVLDKVRREAEASDNPQGFQLIHSLGGGTGSGMGTLLIQKINEEYPDKQIYIFSVVPSPKTEFYVQPYNAILSFHYLMEASKICMIIDNEALYDICFRKLKLTIPQYKDLNQIAAIAMSGATCSLRFPKYINTNLNKLASNLIPFPRLTFLTSGLSPIICKDKQIQQLTLNQITQDIFEPISQTCAANLAHGKQLSASINYQGNVSLYEAEQQIYNIKNNNSKMFISWLPDNIKSYVNEIPQANYKLSSTLISNSTSIEEMFKRILNQFNIMFKRKSFLHWFQGEGMDELEFIEAQSNVDDLVSEYQQYADISNEQQIQK